MGCTCGRMLENPVGGKNRKIGPEDKTSFDTSAGPPGVGGTCIAVTGGCKYCYATAQQKVMASFGGKATANATLAYVNPEKYATLAIKEISHELERRSRLRRRRSVAPLKLIRIHGFGDFFSTRHILAWVRIVRAFPQIKFFGTTRTWRLGQGKGESWLHPSKPGYVPDRVAFVAALEKLRHEPNVFLGASIDESTRNAMAAKHLTHGRNVNIVDWLRSKGWNIWNALTDFGDHAERDEAKRQTGQKVPILRTDPHATVTPAMQAKAAERGVHLRVGDLTPGAKATRAAAKKQGQIAAEMDPPKLLGPICYEQAGERKNCSTCMYCAQPGIMVTFAYHSGSAKKVTPARSKGFDSGYLKSMREYGLEVPVGPDGSVVVVTPISTQSTEAQTNLEPGDTEYSRVAEGVRKNPIEFSGGRRTEPTRERHTYLGARHFNLRIWIYLSVAPTTSPDYLASAAIIPQRDIISGLRGVFRDAMIDSVRMPQANQAYRDSRHLTLVLEISLQGSGDMSADWVESAAEPLVKKFMERIGRQPGLGGKYRGSIVAS